MAFIGSNLLSIPIIVVASEGDELTPVGALLTTLVLDGTLIATALLFAGMIRRPKAWHFGLRATRLWGAVGWSALAYLAYIAFAAIYVVTVGEPAEQTTADDVGADEGGLALLNAGLLFVVLAPIGEEFFFRGFLYRTLRSRFRVLPAALFAGAVFGSIHVFTGLEAVPILGGLGVILCLLYEKTGSLYPCIALHVVNNTLAYGATTDAGAAEALAFGVPMLAACFLLPRFLHRSSPALP
ncbi:MAG TPA: type II CAAX endopeptidase family protein [Thermoleophilaceae bacterium]|nr:type II CAAX endopeptidase family protein [Thermoleophilaceae bacterium]